MPKRNTNYQGRGRSTPIGWARLAAALLLLFGSADFAFAATVKHQDWAVDCGADKNCIAHLDTKGVQILVGRASANAPLRMALRVAASAKTGEPVAMRLGDGWQAGLLVGVCAKTYCEVAVANKATDVALAALSKNNDGLVAYQVGQRILLVPFSLAGFKEAVNDVK